MGGTGLEPVELDLLIARGRRGHGEVRIAMTKPDCHQVDALASQERTARDCMPEAR
jgi:hypothetical protein